MKRSLISKIVLALVVIVCCHTLFSAPPKLPDGYPPGLYDEDKVPQFTLPDPLVLQNGEKVTDVNIWQQKRRPEIIRLFEENVFGHTMIGRPNDMAFKITDQNDNALDGKAVTKKVVIYFVGKEDGPKMELNIILPSDKNKPAPVFLVPGWGPKPPTLINRGYGLITFDPRQIEMDKKDGYQTSIRKFFAKPGQTQPEPNEWAAIGAWAWAMSRAMDYIVTDKDIDPNKVCVFGFSRYGKVANWAAAQDERFALIVSGQAGCGGATLVRRGYGETVRSVNGYAPHWFCGNFKQYGNKVNDLPVDWNMLFALMAPRPVFVFTAQQDYWGDPTGSFLAAKAAEPVYNLYGKKGLDDCNMPPAKTLVGNTVVYYMREDGHGFDDSDLQQILNFADRQFRIVKTKK